METGVIIVGGGLSGLHTARTLHERGVDFLLVEARDRIGGRIFSVHEGRDGYDATEPAYDLGPAWFWPGQARMAKLVEALGVSTFEQQTSGAMAYELPDGAVQNAAGYGLMSGSYRINGGIGRLAHASWRALPQDRVLLNHKVTRIKRLNEGIGITCSTPDDSAMEIVGRTAVVTVPPRLAAHSISFAPDLPAETKESLLAVPTWMAGHAKILATYERPVWREAGFSGSAVSRRGPLMEIHDASPADGGPHALFGFVGTPPALRQQAGSGLTEAALAQLANTFGPWAGRPLCVKTKDWATDPLTATPLDLEPLHHHPAYGLPDDVRWPWDDRLIFSGTETAPAHGGFLEGALEASERTLALLLSEDSAGSQIRSA